MACISPSAATWRVRAPDWTDADVESELYRAWVSGRMHKHAPYHRNYHDWCAFRAAALREARKRGLDFSITGLGT